MTCWSQRLWDSFWLWPRPQKLVYLLHNNSLFKIKAITTKRHAKYLQCMKLVLIYYLFIYLFICIGVSSACMSVKVPDLLGKGKRCVGARNWTESSGRADSTVHYWAISPALSRVLTESHVVTWFFTLTGHFHCSLLLKEWCCLSS